MKNDQNPATAHYTITTARQTTSAHLYWCGADPSGPWPAPVASHGGHCPERIHIFAILAGFLVCVWRRSSWKRREREGGREWCWICICTSIPSSPPVLGACTFKCVCILGVYVRVRLDWIVDVFNCVREGALVNALWGFVYLNACSYRETKILVVKSGYDDSWHDTRRFQPRSRSLLPRTRCLLDILRPVEKDRRSFSWLLHSDPISSGTNSFTSMVDKIFTHLLLV